MDMLAKQDTTKKNFGLMLIFPFWLVRRESRAGCPSAGAEGGEEGASDWPKEMEELE